MSAPTTTAQSAPRTRTDGEQTEMACCAYCNRLYTPRNANARFCKAACRAAYSREIGLVGTAVSVRRLKRSISIVIHTADGRALDAPLGARFRLVREP